MEICRWRLRNRLEQGDQQRVNGDYEILTERSTGRSGQGWTDRNLEMSLGKYWYYYLQVNYEVSYYLCGRMGLESTLRPEWHEAEVRPRWRRLCVGKMALAVCGMMASAEKWMSSSVGEKTERHSNRTTNTGLHSDQTKKFEHSRSRESPHKQFTVLTVSGILLTKGPKRKFKVHSSKIQIQINNFNPIQ